MVYGDLLIFNCDGNGGAAFIVALDKATGKERWRRDRRQPADQAYTTPLVIPVAGRDQLISVGAYRAGAYDPQKGTVAGLWLNPAGTLLVRHAGGTVQVVMHQTSGTWTMHREA